MSRQFTFNIGPRDPEDEKQLLNTVIKEAKSGDNVTVNLPERSDRAQALPQARASEVPNDEASQRVGDAVEKHLEQKAAAIKPSGEKSPEEYVRDLVAAVKGLAAAGAAFGGRIAIKVIATKAFTHLLENYATYIEAFRNLMH